MPYHNQKIHSFNLNDKLNGGESVLLTTRYAKLEDGRIDKWHNFELYSYGNHACINLHNVNITPQLLRQLADELEDFEKEVYKD